MAKDLFEVLTDKDLNIIDSYREELMARYDTSIPKAPLNHVLRFWNKNKQFLYHFLGDQLIYKVPIDIECNTAKSNIDKNFADENSSINLLRKWFEDKYPHNNHDADIIWRLFNKENFYYNEVRSFNYSNYHLKSPNSKSDKTFSIRRGAKLMKTIQKLISFMEQEINELPDPEVLTNFFNDYSVMKSHGHITGNLCFSIHPLDYLTMSDNAANWKSCLSLRNRGDYCSGAIEMMNHENILMVYIESPDSYMTIGDYQWNNKIWRELFYIEKPFMVNIKDYPYFSPNITDYAYKTLIELANRLGYGHFEDKQYRLHTGEIYTKDEEKCDSAITIDISFDRMYNDFDTPFTDHHIIFNDRFNDYNYISGMAEVNCLWCGEEVETNDMEDSKIFCNECREVLYCFNCGDEIRADEAIMVDAPLSIWRRNENHKVCVCKYCSNYSFYSNMNPPTPSRSINFRGTDESVLAMLRDF